MTLQEIRKELPHGAIREIAKRAELTDGLISKIFSGKVTSPKESRVLMITAKYLAEYKANEKAATEALQKALTE